MNVAHLDGDRAFWLADGRVTEGPVGAWPDRTDVLLAAGGKVAPRVPGSARCQVRRLGSMGAQVFSRRQPDPTAFLYLGRQVDGGLAEEGTLWPGDWRLANMTVAVDGSSPGGGRRHLAGLCGLTGLIGRLGADMSLIDHWERREDSGEAVLWGEVLLGLSMSLATIVALAAPARVVLGGPLAELPEFPDELGDCLYPLLDRSDRPGPELLSWRGEAAFLTAAVEVLSF